MQPKKTSSIGTKLAIAFLAILLISVSTSLFSLYQLKTVYGGTQVITQRWLSGLKETNEIRHYVHSTRRSQLRLLPTSKVSEVTVRESDIKRHAGNIEKVLNAYAGRQMPAQEKQLFDELRQRIDNVATGSANLLVFMKASEVRDEAQLYALNEKLAVVMGDAEKSLTALIKYNQEGALAAEEEAAERYSAAIRLSAGLIALGTLLVVILAITITRSITRPLQSVGDAMEKVGHGDLTISVTRDRHDEIGTLQTSLAAMTTSLRQLIGQVQESARSVSDVSGEIAAGNQDLSNRTEESANSLQRTNAAIQHLQQTIAHSSESARQANELAGTASEIAARGGYVVTNVVQNMQTITNSSRKISDIIGVIDGIAFQTNILALNAAVEAARAGEQGRGFAVVASEVRSLAQRSAEAAKEIKQLINASVSNIETGSEMVATAGATIQDLVKSVSSVSGMIAQIADSSQNQRQEVSLIHQSIHELEHMTQQNAALVEESSAAADSLKAQAASMLQAIGQFDAGASAVPSPASRIRSPALGLTRV